jgi:hypothetical protein
LGGTGTVAGTVTVADGGTLMVGAESGVIGSLTTGSLVFEAGSTLVLEVSPTSADDLSVTGSITVSKEAAVRVSALDGFVPSTTPVVVIRNDTAADSVVGRFGSVTVVDGEGTTLMSGLMYTAGNGNDIALISDVDPPTGGAVVDGPAADIDFQVSLTTITANWSGFTDGDGTGIDRYEWAIGTTSGGTDVLAYTTDGITGTAATKSGLNLTSGTTYYVSVRAIDKVGNVSTAVTSGGVMADSVAPTTGTVKDGSTAGVDITYQQALNSLSASWSGFADVNGSGIDRYEWAIGTTSGGTDVLAYTSDGITGTAATRSGLNLTSGTTYYVSVRAIDKIGNVSTAVTSDGVMADSVAPTTGTVKDGSTAGIDITYQQALNSLSATWSGFADVNGSGIDRYEWAIGTTSGGTDVLAYTSDGITGTGATRSGLNLTSGTTYYVSVRAIDKIGNVSTAVTSNGVMADSVAPTTGTVKDGSTAGVDITYQQALNSLSASWSGFADVNGSGIDRYEWAIGTTSGGTDVLAYTSDGITGTGATRSGLSLTSGTTYYVSVRAIDKVQNVSTAVTSDGVMADSVAPTAGTVKDGPTAGIDIAYQQSATSFSANWSGFADVNGSGILRFRWAIGTTPGGTDVMAFRSVGTATTASATGLSLNDNVKYYVTVRAIDWARNVTNVFTDGVTVYSLPPVVTAANIRLTGGTAGGGAFQPLDTVTATWNDTPAGDNNSHLLGSVTIDFSRFGGPQSVPATLQNGIWTASYRIAAGFTGTNRNVAVTVVDLAGNSTTTSGTDNAMIAIPGGRADFTDSDGDRYRVQLTGPGLLAIDIDADGNGRGPIQRIQVAGTAPAFSALNVALLGSARTSDKLVRIGSIAGTGLASISAAASDLVGAGVDLAGPLGSLVVRDVANGASIRAGGTAAHRTTIQARRIGAAGEIRLGSTLTNLVAEEVGATRILAAAVGVLNATGNSQARPVVAGNFAANLDITGNVDTISVAGAVRGANWTIGGNLRSLTVRGAIDGLTMNVGGALTWARLGTVRGAAFNVGIRVASFTALTFTDSRLFVGYTPINPSDPMAGATSARFNRALVTRIDSFSVTARTANAFAGSTIAARQIGTVSLSRVATANRSHFGVLADDSISSVVVEAPRFRASNRTAPGNTGISQFRVRVV